MTEYELADYTSSIMGNFLTALTIYFSIVTAYVVTAFVAGDRLTKIQLAIVNTCFVLAAGVVGYLTVLIFDRFFALAARVANPVDAVEPVDFTWPLGILVAVIFISCPIFMWSTRRNSVDA